MELSMNTNSKDEESLSDSLCMLGKKIEAQREREMGKTG